MIEVPVEVVGGTARFRVTVRAESIHRALEIVGDRHPGRDVQLMFPLDPDTFFAGDFEAVKKESGEVEEVA